MSAGAEEFIANDIQWSYLRDQPPGTAGDAVIRRGQWEVVGQDKGPCVCSDKLQGVGNTVFVSN